MTKRAAVNMTRQQVTIMACFALLCAGSLPALGALEAGSNYLLEQAESDSSASVVFTVSVSLERMAGLPSLLCELRSDRNFPRLGVMLRAGDSSSYGVWTPPLTMDSQSGTGSTALTARLRILSKGGQGLGDVGPVFVRCQLVPFIRSGATSSEWVIGKPPASSGRGADEAAPNIVKPGAVLEVSGQAQ